MAALLLPKAIGAHRGRPRNPPEAAVQITRRKACSHELKWSLSLGAHGRLGPVAHGLSIPGGLGLLLVEGTTTEGPSLSWLEIQMPTLASSHPVLRRPEGPGTCGVGPQETEPLPCQTHRTNT